MTESSFGPSQAKRASLAVLLMNIAAFGAMNSVQVSLLPLLGTELHMTATRITFIGTCSALAVFLCSPFWGRKSDEWGRKRMIAFGMAGYAVAAIALVFVLQAGFRGQLQGAHLYAGMWLTRVSQALLLAAMLPAATAYMIDITTPEQRMVGLGRIGASHGIGSIAGPSLISLSVFGLLMPLYAAVTVAAAMAVIVWLFLEEPLHLAHRRTAEHKMRFLDPRYRDVLAVGVASYIALAVSNQTMGFYLPKVLHLQPQQAAGSLALTQGTSAIAMVFVQLVLLPRLGWAPMRYLAIGVPTVAAGFLLLLFANHLLVFMLAAGCIGLGFGMAGPGYSSEVSLRVHADEQGSVAGLTSACPALGFVIGPFSAGLLYDLDPRLPYAVTLILLLALTIVIRHMSRPVEDPSLS